MNERKCINCSERQRCRDSYASWIFFIIGLIATIAMRVVTVLMDANPFYGKIAWYIGVAGFILFFIYKFKVAQARTGLINQKDLVRKINEKSRLSEEDYKAISGILCSLSSRKERINYIFIFVLSGLALILAFYVDFL